MARLGIKRANGDIEYAELTTDKSLVGSHYLTVERYGTPYYAKLGDSVSTHLCVEGSDGQKRYVQKEVKFVWKYVVDSSHPINGFVIPRTGKYKIVIHEMGYENSGDFDRYIEYIYPFTKGTRVHGDDYITTQDGKDISLAGQEWEAMPSNSDGSEWSMQSIEYIGEA